MLNVLSKTMGLAMFLSNFTDLVVLVLAVMYIPFSLFFSRSCLKVSNFCKAKKVFKSLFVCLFVFISDIFTTLNRIRKSYRHISNTMKSWSSNLQGQNILGFQEKM